MLIKNLAGKYEARSKKCSKSIFGLSFGRTKNIIDYIKVNPKV
jgi:hypothetical protein